MGKFGVYKKGLKMFISLMLMVQIGLCANFNAQKSCLTPATQAIVRRYILCILPDKWQDFLNASHSVFNSQQAFIWEDAWRSVWGDACDAAWEEASDAVDSIDDISISEYDELWDTAFIRSWQEGAAYQICKNSSIYDLEMLVGTLKQQTYMIYNLQNRQNIS